MLDRQYFHYVFVALMALGMTVVMSFTTTIANEGLSSQFIGVWLSASALGFIIAFPTALIITPFARYAADKLTTGDL